MDKKILTKVPFVDFVPTDGRAVFLQPFFDKNEKIFKLFLQKKNELTFVYAKPVQACYWADKIIDKTTDIFIPLIHNIINHYSFKTILNTSIRISTDIHNLGIIIEKYFIFLDLFCKKKNTSLSNMIRTDLEYYFGNVRSLYDQLQYLLREIIQISKLKKKLPDSFRKMIQKEPKELQKKYCLPQPLIKYYDSTKDFFLTCRDIRDRIYHGGLTPNFIVCFDDGFAIQKDSIFFPSPLVSKFNIWPTNKIKENNFVSILALVSYINMKILENIDLFSKALTQSIRPLEPISKNYKIFLRGPHIEHLLKSSEYLDKQWVQ